MKKAWTGPMIIVLMVLTAFSGSVWGETQKIAGIVVDEAGNPIPGATFSVVSVEPRTFWQLDFAAQAETGVDGRFSLTVDAGKVPYSFYVAQHPDYGLAWTISIIVTQRGEDPSDLRLVLPKRGSVKGKATDSAGNPVEGAEISAFITLPEGAVEEQLRCLPPCEALLNATTGADGAFVMDGLPVDAAVMLRVKHPDFALAVEGAPPQMQGMSIGTIAVGAEDVTVKLDPGATIEGKITLEETGEPAEGAVLGAMPQRNEPSALLLAAEKVMTDAEGRYVLRGLTADTYIIIVTHPDGTVAPTTIEVAAGAHMTGQNIILGKGVLVSGKFVDGETGDPVSEGHMLIVRPDAMGPSRQTRVEVQPDGTFSFRQPPGDIILFWFTPSGGQGPLQLALSAGEDQTDLILETRSRQPFRTADRQTLRLAGKQAIELDVAEWVHGEPTSLEALQGTGVVLAFWDSAQESVAEVIEALNALVENHPDVAVVAVHSADVDIDALRELAERKQIKFRVALDKPAQKQKGAAFEKYRVKKPPAVFIIDTEGKLRYQDIPLGAVEQALKALSSEN